MACKTCGTKKNTATTQKTQLTPKPKSTLSTSNTTQKTGDQTYFYGGKLYTVKQ